MSFFSLFSRKRNVEQQVEQLRRELANQIQVSQQTIIEEMKHIEKQQVYPLIPQLPSELTRLPEAVKQLQLQVGNLSSTVEQRLPSPLPTTKGTLDSSHSAYIQKTQKANDAIIDYIATHHETVRIHREAEEKRKSEQDKLKASALDLFPEKQTDSIPVIHPPESQDA